MSLFEPLQVPLHCLFEKIIKKSRFSDLFFLNQIIEFFNSLFRYRQNTFGSRSYWRKNPKIPHYVFLRTSSSWSFPLSKIIENHYLETKNRSKIMRRRTPQKCGGISAKAHMRKSDLCAFTSSLKSHENPLNHDFTWFSKSWKTRYARISHMSFCRNTPTSVSTHDLMVLPPLKYLI